MAQKDAYDNDPTNQAEGKTLDITPKSPTQFTQTSGNSLIKVDQLEFAAWAQGDWRITPRADVSFGLRYQVQQHFSDYNNLAPVVGLSYQLRSKGNWKTVVRVGVKETHSTFSMNTYQQLRQSGFGSEQQTVTILTPSYPDASLGGTLSPSTSTISTRRLMDDAAQPYQINPSFGWEQSMPRGMTASVTYNINRGYRQNRNVNINAPYPGTDLDPVTLSLLNSTDTTKYDPNTGAPDPINGLTKKQQGHRSDPVALLRFGADDLTGPPRWDDAAQGGAADGAPRESPEPPAVRGGRGHGWARAAGGVWAAAVAGAAGGESSPYWISGARHL